MYSLDPDVLHNRHSFIIMEPMSHATTPPLSSPRWPLHIAVVGGLDRNAPLFTRIAEEAGHTFELHTGRVNGRGVETLQAMIDRADLVVIITDVNSHTGVQLARRLSVERGRPHLVLRRCGASRFAQLVVSLGGQHAAVAA